MNVLVVWTGVMLLPPAPTILAAMSAHAHLELQAMVLHAQVGSKLCQIKDKKISTKLKQSFRKGVGKFLVRGQQTSGKGVLTIFPDPLPE